LSEDLWPLAELPDRHPPGRGGRKLHVSAGYRWATVGIDGIKLETCRCGGRLYTSTEALGRFWDALTRRRAGGQAAPPAPTPAARGRRQARVDAELDAARVG
jgi:hypothetical protein